MTDSMVDVLIYLYETYMDGEATPPNDHEELLDELSLAGFPNIEVEKAIQWLDELALMQLQPEDWRCATVNSIRIYTEKEQQRLDLECRGFLLFLEQNQILDPASRELVIERALALDSQQITEEELKWIVLLVLMNQPGQEIAFTRIEELVYDEQPNVLH
jgi:Smg protein